MSLWDTTKKIGGFTLDVGVSFAKEIIAAGKESKENKNLSDEELEKNTRLFSGKTAIQKHLAREELKNRKSN